MTTNNLIGYDPLAWMDGAELEEETPVPEVAPTKKATKSKAKAKTAPVEVAQEPVVEDSDEEIVEGEIVDEQTEIAEIEVAVSIDEDGDVEISIETDEESVTVEVSIDETSDNVEAEIEENVALETIDEHVEEAEPEEEVAMSEQVVEESSAQEEPVEEEAEPLAEPHIDLAAESTMKNIATLYKKIRSSLDAHDALEINAADVATIDTATLQLLVSLKKDAPNLGKTVDIIYPSERFLEAAKLLGLLEILEV